MFPRQRECYLPKHSSLLKRVAQNNCFAFPMQLVHQDNLVNRFRLYPKQLDAGEKSNFSLMYPKFDLVQQFRCQTISLSWFF
jgi:hypothetical protein